MESAILTERLARRFGRAVALGGLELEIGADLFEERHGNLLASRCSKPG